MLLTSSACPRREPTAPIAPPPPVSPGPKVQLPDGGMTHTARLAWMGWSAAGAFEACSRRTTDFTEPGAGRIGRCLVVEAPGGAASQHEFVEGAFARDSTPPDRAPGACRVLLEDIPGDPGLPPSAAARASLVAPAGRTALDAWRPANSVDGDQFAVEVSFSPDGKHVALVHTAAGRGDDLSAEVLAVEVRVAPDCK